MNSYVLIYLNGDVADDLLIYGAWPSFDAAMLYAISTCQPWNWQPCECYGYVVNGANSNLAPVTVAGGFFLAVASAITPYSNVRPIGYVGSFTDKSGARMWASTQQNPSAYSFGPVTAAPGV